MKFLIKWTKQGNMRYISHLDIIRLFQRSLKRTGIKLKYSEGYSPHPKMSIGQPLSLGYTSRGEYFEFETIDDFDADDILARLNGAMPEGIEMLSCGVITETKKAAGALITQAEYLIGIGSDSDEYLKAAADAVKWFSDQDEILIEKTSKKSGKTSLVNIREKVKLLEIAEDEDSKAAAGSSDDAEDAALKHIMLRTIVDAGNNSNLNPLQIIEKIREYTKDIQCESEYHVERSELYAESAEGGVIPLYLLK